MHQVTCKIHIVRRRQRTFNGISKSERGRGAKICDWCLDISYGTRFLLRGKYGIRCRWDALLAIGAVDARNESEIAQMLDFSIVYFAKFLKAE